MHAVFKLNCMSVQDSNSQADLFPKYMYLNLPITEYTVTIASKTNLLEVLSVY